MRFRNSALAILGLATFVACGENAVDGIRSTSGDSADLQRVSTVSVSLASSSIAVGAKTQATAVVRARFGAVMTRTVTWQSSNSAVASVSPSGLVTGVGLGTASISAVSGAARGSAAVTITAGAPSPGTVPAAPGAVADLSASSVGATSVTLSFTAVDDGAGGAASYDVRYAVAPLSWGGAPNVTSGTCATPFIASASKGTITCTVLGLSPSTNYNFQLVSFSGTWSGSHTYGSLSNVAVATTAASPSSPTPPAPTPPAPTPPAPTPPAPTPPAPTPPAPTPPTPIDPTSHEPTGMTKVTERAFNAVNEDGWVANYNQTNNCTIVQDATAPKSSSNVAQFKYPQGFQSGGAPCDMDRGFGGNYRTMYWSWYFKYANNYYGDASGVGKHGFLWSGGRPTFVPSCSGAGSGPLTPEFRLQDNASGNYGPNVVPSTRCTRGVWHKWEVLVSLDGNMDSWFDGVLVGHYTGIGFSGDSWGTIQFAPNFGGAGGPPMPAETYLWIDHLYLSGK